MAETRKLASVETSFWNSMSIGILIDSSFVVEINDGLIVGIGTPNVGKVL